MSFEKGFIDYKMANLDVLKNAGIDTDALIKRLMGNEALISVFVKKFTEDKTFEELKAAFGEKDIKQAEIKSHTLKGMCGNLSLTRLYDLFAEQTMLLRRGEFDEAEAMMTDICSIYSDTISKMLVFLS